MAKNTLIGDYPIIGIRAAARNAFGMDKEVADYRACEILGALYR